MVPGDAASDMEAEVQRTRSVDTTGQREKNAGKKTALGHVIPMESDSDPKYPKGLKLAVVVASLASLAASVFLCALDETIITTAIPRITHDFKTIKDVGWYGSAYFMTFAAFQLIYGKLFSFYPIKNVFLVSIVIFEVGALICATAPTSSVFIVGRACAGLGSAGINAGFIIILPASLPLERRPLYVSSYSGMYGIASVAAPLLGGAFTTDATWRWCFYVNLPIGGIALLAISFFFHPPRKAACEAASTTWREKMIQMDLPGTAVLVPGIICLLLALQWGGSVYSWSSAPAVVPLVSSAVLLIGFIAIQMWKQDEATVPPRIIKQRSVVCSAIYVFVAGGALNVFEYFVSLPCYPSGSRPPCIQGVTAFNSGTRILPTTMGTVLFSFVAGLGVAKTGYYTPFMIVGAALLLTGAALTTTWKVESPATQWIGYQIIVGAGAGLGIQQAHTAAQNVLAATDVPTGAVVLIFAQIMGGTVWVPVAQNVLTGELLKGLVGTVPGLDPKAVLDMGATGLRGAVDLHFLDGVLRVYNSALTRIFCCAVALTAVALIAAAGMGWKSIKKKT